MGLASRGTRPIRRRILLINQYFWPDMAATAQLLGDLAEELAADPGWRVTALAGKGSYAPGRPGPLPSRERWREVEVRRVASTSFGRGSVIGRVTDYATFFVGAMLAVLFGRRQDVVVALSTPPLVALLGWLAQLRGSRFVYKVEDLYPDVAVALGAFGESSLAARVFSRLSRFLLSRADAVVALDGAMARVLAQRGARRVEVIPNWADGEAIRPDPEAGVDWRREQGIDPGRTVILYSGNLGLAHRFDAVTDAARRLAENSEPPLFLFVGAGPRLEEVRQATRGLPHVRFLPYQPREQLGEMYNAADIHLVTLRDEVAGLLVPSKYAASLAAGKPVLLVGGEGTDLHREIRHEGLGWAVPHSAAAVLETVDEIRGASGKLHEIGRESRIVFEKRYNRSVVMFLWIQLLDSVAETS